MHIEKKLLIQDLLRRTELNIVAAKNFKLLSLDDLNFKKESEQWSILECIEHLNLYGDYYLVEMEQRMLNAKNSEASNLFKSGWLGNYFANMMLVPENGKIKKMKSPKDKDPIHSELSLMTIERFLKQQDLLKKLLQEALLKDLAKLKTAISISKWIKLRLGDTFRFFVYHNQRHIAQAEKIITYLKSYSA